jgi:hypothetical protein
MGQFLCDRWLRCGRSHRIAVRCGNAGCTEAGPARGRGRFCILRPRPSFTSVPEKCLIQTFQKVRRSSAIRRRLDAYCVMSQGKSWRSLGKYHRPLSCLADASPPAKGGRGERGSVNSQSYQGTAKKRSRRNSKRKPCSGDVHLRCRARIGLCFERGRPTSIASSVHL